MSQDNQETPYIASPDTMDDDPRNGLVCFLNMDRQCGPDCMSWQTYPAESTYLSDDQKHCVLLIAAERLGRYAGGILKHMKDSAADSRRTPATPPVNTPTKV